MSYLLPRTGETFAEGFVREVFNDLKDIKHSFIRIGFRLNEANQMKYFEELGYSSIVELAEDKFGFKHSTTYDLIKIWRFAHDKDQPMQIDERFDKFSQTQLVEMSRSKHDNNVNWRLASIIPETASKEDIKKVIAEWNRWTDVRGISDVHFSVCLEKPPLLIEENSSQLENSEEEQEEQTDLFQPAGMNGEEQPVLVESATKIYGLTTDNAYLMDNPEEKLTSEELINHCLKERANNKFLILSFYTETGKLNKEEFIKFLKRVYGNGGHNGNGCYRWIDYGSKGFRISRSFGGDLLLSWALVAGRIAKLINNDDYLYPEEKEEYTVWLSERENEASGINDNSSQLENSNEKQDYQCELFQPAGKNEVRPTNREWLQTLSDKEYTKMIYQFLWLLSSGMSPRPYIQKELENKFAEWLSKPHKTIMEFLNEGQNGNAT